MWNGTAWVELEETANKNQPGGYVGLDANSVASVNIVPRSGTWANLRALYVVDDDEPVDGELVYVTDVAGGVWARWNATDHAPDLSPHELERFVTGYWPLDEGSGASRLDAIGNGTTLANNGTVGSEAGSIGNRATFLKSGPNYLSAASNGFVQAGHASNPLLAPPFTLICIALLDAVNASHTIIAKHTSVGAADNEYHLRYSSGNSNFNFDASSGVTLTTVLHSGLTVIIDTPYFIICRHNPLAGTLGIRASALTSDSLKAEVTASHTTGVLNTAHGFRIGKGGTSVNAELDGAIDESVLIKHRILTESECQRLFHRAKAGLRLF